jgi:Uma2 family endonuclease
MATSRAPLTAPKAEVEYPSGDGQPMAETPIHVEAIMLLHQALQDFFRDRPDVFIASDIFWYWEEGNPDARRAPDVMIAVGVARDAERRSFFSWKEGGAVPAALFEMASENTWREDLGPKRHLYEKLGVSEYFLFDPEGAYLRPPLQGFRLQNGGYRLLDRTEDDRLVSELGFDLRAEGRLLRVLDGRSGRPIPTREERAEQEHQRAEQERQRAEQERQRAEQERQRAEQLEAELRQLRQRLGDREEGSGA